MNASLPTLKEISVYGSIDEQYAVEHFLGKDLKQAEEMFRENFGRYQEDLMWMGPRAFCYYVQAAIAYLRSPAADDDTEAVYNFCAAVGFQFDHYREGIEPALDLIREALQEILNGFAELRFDGQLWCDVEARCRALLVRLDVRTGTA